ncbi:hypothetical protein [Aliiruegeria haliotis]|uniref:hypothetical protein n=1 Tax=Aliiruegeria haliotis TaxID=1280846 RepID=UPI0014754ED5|nr:hypothetical protein [Aliiruegeria haliotis]
MHELHSSLGRGPLIILSEKRKLRRTVTGKDERRGIGTSVGLHLDTREQIGGIGLGRSLAVAGQQRSVCLAPLSFFLRCACHRLVLARLSLFNRCSCPLLTGEGCCDGQHGDF